MTQSTLFFPLTAARMAPPDVMGLMSADAGTAVVPIQGLPLALNADDKFGPLGPVGPRPPSWPFVVTPKTVGTDGGTMRVSTDGGTLRAASRMAATPTLWQRVTAPLTAVTVGLTPYLSTAMYWHPVQAFHALGIALLTAANPTQNLRTWFARDQAVKAAARDKSLLPELPSYDIIEKYVGPAGWAAGTGLFATGQQDLGLIALTAAFLWQTYQQHTQAKAAKIINAKADAIAQTQFLALSREAQIDALAAAATSSDSAVWKMPLFSNRDATNVFLNGKTTSWDGLLWSPEFASASIATKVAVVKVLGKFILEQKWYGLIDLLVNTCVAKSHHGPDAQPLGLALNNLIGDVAEDVGVARSVTRVQGRETGYSFKRNYVALNNQAEKWIVPIRTWTELVVKLNGVK